MTRPKSIIGALLACALAICAFAAANASAAGLTAVECVEQVGGKYNTSACLTPAVAGNFETKVIEGKQAVEGTDTRFDISPHQLGNTANPTTIFHTIFGGVKTTVTCGAGKTTGGSIENKTVGEEMQIHTTGASVTWSECHAALTDGTKQCKVQGIEPAEPEGSIKTNPLTAITGANHSVKISAEGVLPITKFKILKKPSTPECFTAADITVTVNGKATGTADTTTHSHLTVKEPWECGLEGQPACGELTANGVRAAQTQTVTGVTKGTTKLVGAETF